MRVMAIVLLATAAVIAATGATPDEAGRLTVAAVRNTAGDGPDGKGNTGDDTWQFWFQLMHDRSMFMRLDLATELQTEEVRKNGIKRKVWGPLGSTLPNPQDSEGWIYHSDWDGKREGVWGDTKDKQVLVVPYAEKGVGGALAVTYKVPADGTYIVSGKAADLEVNTEQAAATGVQVSVEVVQAGDGKSVRRSKQVVVQPVAIGDKAGPASADFRSERIELKKGQLVMLIVDPGTLAQTDTTKVEFNVTAAPVGEPDHGTKDRNR
ncbi:MAG: hypothetical protein ABFD92_10815 [Planctomycetaceae bacterium]|nr:hypothetical protein [Planctomycetaceae bacterium]